MSELVHMNGLGEFDAESAGRLKPSFIERRVYPDLRNETQLKQWRELQFAAYQAKARLRDRNNWRKREVDEEQMLSDELPALLRRQAE